MPDEVYVRAPEIDEDSFEEELLLFQRQLRTVVSLNASAACLWQALAWPQSEASLVALLVDAGIAESRAAETTSELLRVLIEQGLVVPASP